MQQACTQYFQTYMAYLATVFCSAFGNSSASDAASLCLFLLVPYFRYDHIAFTANSESVCLLSSSCKPANAEWHSLHPSAWRECVLVEWTRKKVEIEHFGAFDGMEKSLNRFPILEMQLPINLAKRNGSRWKCYVTCDPIPVCYYHIMLQCNDK